MDGEKKGELWVGKGEGYGWEKGGWLRMGKKGNVYGEEGDGCVGKKEGGLWVGNGGLRVGKGEVMGGKRGMVKGGKRGRVMSAKIVGLLVGK